MRLLALLPILFLISCCPKEGVDRSSTINDYILAVDYFNDNTPVKASLIPDEEINLQLTDNTGHVISPKYISRNSGFENRLLFFFSEDVKEESIHSFSGKLSGATWNDVGFQSYNKSIYQKDPIKVSSVDLKSQFLCVINNIGNTLLPSANAMSCKAKDGSQITYRPGALIRVDL
jgi:hypothetical protein